MLRYHPVHDPHHAAFRFLRLLVERPERKLEALKLRILDFYLLFPAEIESIQFPNQIRRWKTRFRAESNKYFSTVSRFSVFHQMQEPQEFALLSLEAREVVNCSDDYISLNLGNVPSDIEKKARRRNEEQEDLVYFLVEHLADFELHGNDGLKRRTGLAEFKYDAT